MTVELLFILIILFDILNVLILDILIFDKFKLK